MKPAGGRSGSFLILLIAAVACSPSCNIFETRDPEPPTQSGFQYLPRTFPSNVIYNLEVAVAQKDVAGYMACIAQQGFVFTPSARAAVTYAPVLNNWTYQQEQSYFENLVARRKPQSFSSLRITPTDSVISGDTRTYGCAYTFTFEHTDTSFTQGVSGNLQFTLLNMNSQWTITEWLDIESTSELTWSSFKGRFSN